jgi:tetratricopeptide (TPR) repeat protein
MAEAIDDAHHLATTARAHREAGDRAAAGRVLEQGIDVLEAALTEKDSAGSAVGSEEAAIAVHLADLYGMLGGTLREEGNYLAAAAAYDRGFRLESDPRYAMNSTYNALNRLTTRILLCPACLADPDRLRTERHLEFVDVRNALADLSAQLRRQLSGARAGDFWAAGDLSLTCALSGDEQGMKRGLEEFIRLSPPPGAYDAYRRDIEVLARLDTPEKALLLTAERAWSRQ